MSAGPALPDLHTACLNRLAGAFLSDACKGLSLGDKGYEKYIDPKFELDGNEVQTDFLSIGVDDAQHYKIVGAKQVVGQEKGIIANEDKIESQLEEVVQFKEITSEAVQNFLSSKSSSASPSVNESVAVLPSSAYEQHEEFVDDFCENNNIVVWETNIEGTERVRKANGKHTVPDFDELLSKRGSQDGIYLYDVDSSILPVVRKSDMQLIKFTFAKRLITYSYHEQTTEIPYSMIDDIMLDHNRPILGHLPPNERDEYWQRCMLSLQTTLEVISESKDEINVFEWEKERFLYDKSARSKLTEEIRSGLGIGVGA